jgi:putative ATP-dependent endonuclease of OLD family
MDLFPNSETNNTYLKCCFENLNHKKSFENLVKANGDWADELINRIGGTVMKGRFAQELSLLIDKDFKVPDYIEKAILHIAKCKNIEVKNAQ